MITPWIWRGEGDELDQKDYVSAIECSLFGNLQFDELWYAHPYLCFLVAITLDCVIEKGHFGLCDWEWKPVTYYQQNCVCYQRSWGSSAQSPFSHICIPYLALGYVGSSSFELCFRIIAKHWDCFVNHNILQWAKKSYFTGTENILSSSEITNLGGLLFHWNRECSEKNTTFPKREN